MFKRSLSTMKQTKKNKRTSFADKGNIFTVLRSWMAAYSLKRAVLLVLVGVGVGILAALIITFVTRATTNTVNLEPENGANSSHACVENGAATSGGKSIKFQSQPCLTYKDIIVSPTGLDSNSRDGSSAEQAYKTISFAVSKVASPSRIRIMAGTYIEQVTIQKTDIIIEPYGNGDVTINGAIPEFLTAKSWTSVQSGLYKYNLGRDEYRSDGSNVIYGSDGQQQWTYPDIGQIYSLPTVGHLPGVFLVNNIFSQSEVHVATNTGRPPTAPLYIGGKTPTLYFKNSRGIHINSVANSRLKIEYGSYNIYLNNTDNVTINDVDIVGGKSAVLAFDSSNVSITNNQLHGTFGRAWDWADVKEGNSYNTMENQALQIKAISKDVSNVVVSGNDMSGYFNGVNFDVINPYFINSSVIANNKIHDSSDDGIEIDAQYKNLVVKGNTVYDVYSPISSTAGAIGPVDVYENLFIANRAISDDHGATTSGPGYPIKMNNVDTPVYKNIHFYQNTFYYAGGATQGRYTVHSTAGKETHDVTFLNNIFYSYGGGLIRGTGRAQDNVVWSGNLFYSVKDDPATPWDDNFWAWNDYYNSDDVNNYSHLSQIIAANKMPAQWQGNIEGDPDFNCVDPLNTSCFRVSAAIAKPASKQPLPSTFTDSSRLNARTRLGAFE